MGVKEYLILLSTLAVLAHNSHGCQMEGIINWNLPVTVRIQDIFRGVVLDRSTDSILGINNVVFAQDLNRGPYLNVTHSGSQLTIRTNNAFADYEEYETSDRISFTATFACTGGNTNTLVFLVNIIDTNNNDPIFRPDDVYEIRLTPPLPPGYRVTGCWDDIFSRDIDLTTQRVDYQIYDSPYFEIAYDAESSNVPKEFHAMLRTTTFIRSIPEPLELRISATDVDLTNDPPRTTFATVRIISDGEFDLPEEPVFSQTFYLATYSEDHQVALQETISLRQGFHAQVQFSLRDSEYSHYFDLMRNGNEISIRVDTQLPVEVLRQQQILLVVQAERSFTSGASATIVVQLPERRVLSFGQAWYVGQIVEGSLRLPALNLIGGNDLAVQLTATGEFASYFNLSRESNNIIVTTNAALPPEAIENNAFILLDIEASYPEAASGVTTVILELVTEPVIHPVFDQAYYTGQYSNERGLVFQQTIQLAQGYDESVLLDLDGDDSQSFSLVRNGANNFTLSLRGNEIPNVDDRHQLVFSVVASKPDGTPGRATIVITLTGAILSFSQASYAGRIVEGTLDLPPLTLIRGYDLPIQTRATGAFAAYFTLTRESNNIVVRLNSALPAEIVNENSIILLDIEAYYPEAVSGFTAVVLELIQEPIVHPVFDQTYYTGEYTADGGLIFEQTIQLVQEFDDTVSFALEGGDSAAFNLVPNGQNRFTLSVNENEIVNPAEIHQLIFSVVATKPDSISGRAAIVIALTDIPDPLVIGFAQASYVGQIVDNSLNLPPVTISGGVNLAIQLNARGAYASYFTLARELNNIVVSMDTTLPPTIVANNAFITLDIEASNPDAIPGFTTIVLELVREPIIHPVFDQAVYSGEYSNDEGLLFGQTIQLIQGFDDTVSFALDGEDAHAFRLVSNGQNNFTLAVNPIEIGDLTERSHLVFSVVATKPNSIAARAAIVISLTEMTSNRVLRFERVSYLGSIVENVVNLDPIVLSDGYTSNVSFTLHGDLRTYFRPNAVGNTVTLTLLGPIASEDIPSNGIILLSIEASAVQALSTFATIVLEIEADNTPTLSEPIFAEAFYVGTFSTNDGLVFDDTITLADGYDASITFGLEAEHSQWFDLARSGNSVRVIVQASNPIPPAVVANNQQLLFVVTAQRPGSTVARTTIVIALSDGEGTPDRVLGFDRITYVGSIVENTVNLDSIVLSEGYTSDVSFTLLGELQRYFGTNQEGNTVTLVLLEPIAEEDIPPNGIILLNIQASAAQSLSAFATIVLEIEPAEVTPTLPEPIFAEAFYVGTFSTNDGLVFDDTITLADGYDASITFGLEAEHSQWFDLARSGNSVRVIVQASNPIPPAVVANNQQLLFVVTAQRPGSTVARTTIVIALSDGEGTPDRVLGFDRITYVGSIVENTVNLDSIVLSEGYTSDVSFTLLGELQRYFGTNQEGNTVTLVLLEPIAEEDIPPNGIILLNIQASAAQSLSAFATIVLEIEPAEVTPTLPEPIFAEAFYVGTFSTNDGLVFDDTITLADGYDASITFGLEAEHSQWFDLARSGNSVRVIVQASNPIPPAVVANNQQLLFVVTAQRPGSTVARTTIVIALSDGEGTPDRVLGFDRMTYVGSIVENTVNLDSIVLSEGYTSDVSFTLLGELQRYFRTNEVGNTVTLVLLEPIAEEDIPPNGIILLNIQASAAQSLSAFATIVLEIEPAEVTPTLPEPIFAEAFYVGTFSTNDGLVFDDTITLADGYDASITFGLEAEHSQWFDLARSGNSVRVIVQASNPIPPAVVANNQQLLFVVTAQRPGSTVARTTIVIALSDGEGTPDRVLGFDRMTYVGSIVENTVNLDSIVLSEGYTSDVSFTLLGELQRYFRTNEVGNTVTLVLLEPIAEEDIPPNGIILLNIQASAAQSLSAFATIVLEIEPAEVTPTLPEPIFAEAFYVGTFSTNDGLVFDDTITLADGYDASITFGLEAEHSQWFDLARSGNSVRVIVQASNPIPPAVVANNQQLLFVVTAQRPGSTVARTTIVIALSDGEGTPDRVLGFDRMTYVGSIVENTVNLDSIVLSEGYTSDVSFTLLGELQRYFRTNEVGNTVTLVLLEPIAEEDIPPNGIILLNIQASAAQSLSAFATIVLEIEPAEVTPTLPEPIFAEAFYVGTFSTNDGLVFDDTITLADGYDASITFGLEAEHSQWFDLARSGNSVRVIVQASNPIPPAVVANNQQLLFVVTAQRPGSTVARTTIVIALSDGEGTPDRVLGFDRMTYVGSIVENTVNLDSIVLSEGYTSDVSFTLLGELQRYFRTNEVGNTVTLVLLEPIAEEDIPPNGIILLNIQASAAQSLSAFATIVLEIEPAEVTPTLPEPIFAEAFYVGTFSTNDGLVFDDTITLADGYDASITFGLEAEHSQWFDLARSGNSVRVIVQASNPIPPAVVANNQQLLFVVTAQRPGSTVARTTIVIALSDGEGTPDRVLGFDRMTYVGSIVENTVNLDSIVLSEGYTSDVSFTLLGELQRYFRTNEVGNTVTLVLLEPIAEEDIPPNGIILLNIQASAAQSLSAFATIVLEIEPAEVTPTLPEPIFAEAFYVGTFSTNDGLVFDDTITLADGYDASITFGLEAEHSQWFDLARSGNSVRVIVQASNPIPPAVVANNQQLLFVVTAQRPGSTVARTTIVIALSDGEGTPDRVLGFDRMTYVGSIVENTVNLDSIVLSEGYTSDVSFTLLGELQRYFRTNEVGNTVTLVLLEPIAEEDIPPNGIILLNIQASAAQSLSAFATIVLEIEPAEVTPTLPEPIFAEAFYVGTFSTNDGLVFDDTITLADGYDASITFGLEAEHSQWFDLARSGNSVRVIVQASNPIPPAVVANNQQLLFVVTAQRPGSTVARTTIVIALSDGEGTPDRVLGFDRMTYVGSIVENTVNLDSIVLSEGYTSDVSFTLLGELQRYFRTNEVGNTVTLVLLEPIAEEDIPPNGIILLNIQASAAQSLSAFATIVLEIEPAEVTPTLPEPIFAEAFYVGTFSTNDGLVFDDTITLADGYDASITFGLEAEHSQWFDLARSGNSVRVIVQASNPIPPAVVANNQQLLFVVTAQRPGSTVARTTIVIALSDGEGTPDRVLGFDRMTYVGSIVENTVNLDSIVLSEGYTSDVSFTLLGELQRYFRTNEVGNTVTLVLLEPIAEEDIPPNGIILLNIQASAAQSLSAFATIVLEIEPAEVTPTLPEPIFAEAFYVGTFSTNDGLVFDDTITLADGYDASITFGLEAEHSQWFDLARSGNSVRVIVQASNPIPPAVVANYQQLLFVVTAQRPGSTIARATIVILLTEEDPEVPPVSVSFDSPLYVVRVEMGQTGVVGYVSASTNNGEIVNYSLLIDNEHLRARISVNNLGELRLSAPVNSGIYSFQAVAITAYSQATGMAPVRLSVEAVTVCGEDTVIPPLIVLDRDEEEPLRDLVLLNTTEHAGCQYSLTSRWPVDQTWLYVDETGLHATAIDREDPSIAFMALSQVSIELTLTCDSDVRRSKRSTSERMDWLGPYDYGTNTWVLGESILFNSRRSIVNLVVNDINDNAPIFIGRENEPIIVGYPVPDLQQIVLPRSLAELQATDADIGENAALVYWSSEPELAVSPTTGFIHVRNERQLEQDQILTVYATDLNGRGLTGSITLMVKLLDTSNIAVITVRNSFLEDENQILGNISNLIGYEVRTLRSVVISEAEEERVLRTKRQATATEASLEMYVYGLFSREPVAVDRLIIDIESATVESINIVSAETLEDHLEDLIIRDVDSGNNVGLLAATIVLSILLFLLIIAGLVWYFIRRWRQKERDYDQFSDMNSLGSQNDSLGQPQKPFDATALSKPKLNIEELKRSERRLQDMLSLPVEEVSVIPGISNFSATINSATKTLPSESLPAIVIQDKLKDAAEESDNDEFGEVKLTKRKSVVTFNENVEKIIHVDETPTTEPDIDVYKF